MSEANTETVAPDRVVIAPRGRLDLASAPGLRQELRSHVEAGKSRLIVDLSAIELIDSAGLSALISGLKAARQAGGTLHISNPSKPVKALLKLTNLQRVLEVDDSANGAIDEAT